MEKDLNDVGDSTEMFREFIKEHGVTSPKAVGFGNPQGSLLRLAPIHRLIGDCSAKSLMDVGAGNGAVLRSGLFKPAFYLGVDVVPEFTHEIAFILSELNRPGEAVCASIIDYVPTHPLDWIMMVGVNVFKDVWGPDERLFFETLKRLWPYAKEGIVFTCASAHAPTRFDGRLYYDASYVLAWCGDEITPYVTMDHGYCLHDFTVVLRRNPVEVPDAK